MLDRTMLSITHINTHLLPPLLCLVVRFFPPLPLGPDGLGSRSRVLCWARLLPVNDHFEFIPLLAYVRICCPPSPPTSQPAGALDVNAEQRQQRIQLALMVPPISIIIMRCGGGGVPCTKQNTKLPLAIHKSQLMCCNKKRAAGIPSGKREILACFVMLHV